MYLSPYVEEPLNSKVIKSFVPELRSRQVFSVYVYTCYEHNECFAYRYEYLAMVHFYIQQ